MAVMLRKLRSFWRWTADTALQRMPAREGTPTHADTPTPENGLANAASTPVSDTVASDRALSRTDRVGKLLNSLRGDLRTLESKVDAFQSRQDRLLQSNAFPANPGNFSEIHTALAALSEQMESEKQARAQLAERVGQIDAHACGLGAMNESITTRIELLSKELSQAREREAEQSELVHQFQAQLNSINDSIQRLQSELGNQVIYISRDVSSRMIGLYLIGCVALTVAVATLIIVLTSGKM